MIFIFVANLFPRDTHNTIIIFDIMKMKNHKAISNQEFYAML